MAAQGMKIVYVDPWNRSTWHAFVVPNWPNHNIWVAACNRQCCTVIVINIVAGVVVAAVQQWQISMNPILNWVNNNCLCAIPWVDMMNTLFLCINVLLVFGKHVQMLHPADKLDAVFSKYPHPMPRDALATSLITVATLAKIKEGTPLWPSHILKSQGGATTLHTHESSTRKTSQCMAAYFVCASLGVDLVWLLCRNQWQTE